MYSPTDEELAALAAMTGNQPIPADPNSDVQMAPDRAPPGAQISDDVAAILKGMTEGQQPVPGSYQIAHGAGGGIATPPPPAPTPDGATPAAQAQTGWGAVFGTTTAAPGLKPPPPAAPAPAAVPPPAAIPGTEARNPPPALDPNKARKDAEALAADIARQKAEAEAAAAAAAKPVEAPKPAETPKSAEAPVLAPGDTPPAGGTPTSTGLGAGDQPPGGPTQQEPAKAAPAAVPAAAPAAGATGPTAPAAPAAATPAAKPPDPALNQPVTDPHAWLESRRSVENAAGDPNAKNPRSSASGLYQITDGTYQATLARHPELAGLDRNNEKVALAVFGDMKAALTPLLGHEPTAGEMNASWLLGPAGAAKALKADPNSPITNVVSGSQLAANPQWLNRDGSPKTVGQVLAEYNSGSTGGGGGGGTGTATAAAPTQPGYADLFNQQQQRIDAYQQGQGKLMDQLKAMYADYMSQTKPSVADQLGDSFNSWAQAHNAAVANQLATQGGVVHHALPNPQPFQQALQAGQQNVMAQRQMMAERAKTGLQFGQQMVSMKNENDYKSLGLSGDLAKNLVDSQFRQTQQGMDQQRIDMEANKVKLELAQFGQSNTEQFTKYLESQVGDPQIRAAITQEALSGGLDTTKSLQANLPALNAIIQKHAATENISGRQNLMDVTWVDPATKKTMHDQIDIATPQGKTRLAEIKTTGGDSFRAVPLAQGAQVNVPVNVNTGGAGGTGKEGGGGGEMTPGKTQEAAMVLQKNAQAAKALIPYIQAHGGASFLTDEDGNKVANAIKQITGIDYTGVAVRTIYDKLMSQIQSGLVLPSLQNLGGRPTGGEFTVFRQGQLGSQSNTVAANAFLDHVLKTTDYEIRKNDFIIDKSDEAKRANDVNFNLEKELRDWRRQGPQNMPPVWDSQGLIDAARKEQEGQKTPTSSGPAARAGAGKTAAPAATQPPAATAPGITPEAAAKGVDGTWPYSAKAGVWKSPDGKKFIDRRGVELNADGSPKVGGSPGA